MKKLIKFPSIEQYRNIVANVNRNYNFVGLDETGEAIYDHSKLKPIQMWSGTVKLHGTNASICFNEIDGYWLQSRENIITPQQDNAGFAMFATGRKDIFLNIINELSNIHNISLYENTITLCMEWVGKGIQKGVAISEIEKSAFIFSYAKVTPFDISNEKPGYWIHTNRLSSPENRIYNLEDYKMYEIEIDFNNPLAVQNKIIEMTLEVENECPVGKVFGINAIGEGIVFSYFKDGELMSFKSKGEKHSKGSKVKTLKPVDDEKLNKLINITNQVCPSWRLEQALDKTFDLINGGSLDIKKLGEFIKAVIADIIKEDLDILVDNELTIKDISGKVSELSRQYFFDKQNEEVGLK